MHLGAVLLRMVTFLGSPRDQADRAALVEENIGLENARTDIKLCELVYSGIWHLGESPRGRRQRTVDGGLIRPGYLDVPPEEEGKEVMISSTFEAEHPLARPADLGPDPHEGGLDTEEGVTDVGIASCNVGAPATLENPAAMTTRSAAMAKRSAAMTKQSAAPPTADNFPPMKRFPRD